MSALDNMLISARIRMMKAGERIQEFLSGEKGVSNVVATIIVLLITVLLIGMFWGKLKIWVNGLMDTIFSSTFE